MKVYLIDGVRSYIGTAGGIFKNISAEQIGASVMNSLLRRLETHQMDSHDIDLVIAGNGVGAGGNIARLMTLSSQLPKDIPACTIDLQCGSGLESIALAAARISSGQADFILAGGFESSSTAPIRSYHPEHPEYSDYVKANGSPQYTVAHFAPGAHTATAMLDGAEETGRRLGITRQDLNHWVLRSHTLAKEARENKILADLITSLEMQSPKTCFDEGIRDRISERLLNYVPLLLPDGQILTAANTCFTNDGAAFLALASETYVKEHGLAPLAEFVDATEACADPCCSPMSIVPAINKLLARNHMKPEDISIFECNEAFAVIDELFCRTYGEKMVERYNIYGGALAYGHPYGASGGIITLHGLRALQNTEGEYGVFSIAAAGGVGTAILVRRI